jgi:hypothetical protein
MYACGKEMILKQFLAGVQILCQYYNDPDGYHLGSDSGVIYLYPTDRPVTPEHVTKLLELGWFQPDQLEEEYVYDPYSGWQAFT